MAYWKFNDHLEMGPDGKLHPHMVATDSSGTRLACASSCTTYVLQATCCNPRCSLSPCVSRVPQLSAGNGNHLPLITTPKAKIMKIGHPQVR